jgi:hypothetical protein
MSKSIPTLLIPHLLNGHPSENRHSTPPPGDSPLPRTPKPQRFLSPPKTPLARFQASFGCAQDEEEGNIDTTMLHVGMAIGRPDSACSNYSISSDSSVDSNMTHSTTEGSCTSIEDGEDDYYPVNDNPKGKGNDFDYVTSAPSTHRQVVREDERKEKERSGRGRKFCWTESMDAHLWKTYALYQQDPKITPFFVLPGQVPPLGVCYKVAREAKRTWKEAKVRGDHISVPLTAPRPKQRTVPPVSEVINRGDAMRRITPFSWPVSESSTRRRLRELCRENYGPSHNPYHYHRQQRRRIGGVGSSDMKPRTTNMSPSPLQSSSSRDPFSTTRNMALSLTTSTSSSMRPNGALASLASGRDIHGGLVSTGAVDRVGFQFGGISERISGVNDPESLQIAKQNVLATGSLGLGLELAHTSGSSGKRERDSFEKRLESSAFNSIGSTPALLPPLELQSTKTHYGTWPRRLKRGDGQDEEIETTTPLPPQRRARRGTLCDLFEGDTGVALATVPLKTRTRSRGYTISAGANPFGTRRRTRVSAPLLTVTGPVSYEGGSVDLGSPLSKRDALARQEFDLGLDLPRRLGSPFMGKETG